MLSIKSSIKWCISLPGYCYYFTNIADLGAMPPYVAFYLGHHCLPRYPCTGVRTEKGRDCVHLHNSPPVNNCSNWDILKSLFLLLKLILLCYAFNPSDYIIRCHQEFLLRIYEPWHEISNNVVCATSKGSDQPAHTHSLIRAYASCLNIL